MIYHRLGRLAAKQHSMTTVVVFWNFFVVLAFIALAVAALSLVALAVATLGFVGPPPYAEASNPADNWEGDLASPAPAGRSRTWFVLDRIVDGKFFVFLVGPEEKELVLHRLAVGSVLTFRRFALREILAAAVRIACKQNALRGRITSPSSPSSPDVQPAPPNPSASPPNALCTAPNARAPSLPSSK